MTKQRFTLATAAVLALAATGAAWAQKSTADPAELFEAKGPNCGSPSVARRMSAWRSATWARGRAS